jgi:hypothetical protein
LEDYVTEVLDILTWSELVKLAKDLSNLKLEDLKQKATDTLDEMLELALIVANLDEILNSIPNITDNKK